MRTLTNPDDGKMPKLREALYTGKLHTTGGRDGGASRSSDGHLDIKLSLPGKGDGTNPEQLLAAGWSACFTSAIGIAARRRRVALPTETTIDAEVDLCKVEDGTHVLQARLNVSLPGLDSELAETLVHVAHETCPYSRATRGNINVVINLV